MAGKSKLNFKQEELVPLARLLRAHYNRDTADFVALLPEEYGAAFLPAYDAQVAAANSVVSYLAASGKTQAIGERMTETLKPLLGLLNRLEARARRVQLTVPQKALGIKPVRDAHANGDMEQLDRTLKVVVLHLDENAAVLAAKGHTAAETATLRALYQSVMQDNTAQDESQTGNQRLTAANQTTLGQLYAMMQDVMADGRSLYRGSDPVRLKDYTEAQLLKRVRQERGDKEEKPAQIMK